MNTDFPVKQRVLSVEIRPSRPSPVVSPDFPADTLTRLTCRVVVDRFENAVWGD